MELIALWAWLRNRLRPPALADLARQVAQTAQRVRGLTGLRRFQLRIPCPLLTEAGACSAYAARPLSCRALTSLDAAACAGPGGTTIEKDAAIGVVGSGIASGALRALRAEEYELTLGLDLLFTDPGAALRWLRGEDAFAAAVVNQATRRAGARVSLSVVP